METVKLIHISSVVLSALFFFSRGVVMIGNPAFVGRRWVKRTAESIDTVLLLSGVGLVWLTGQMPWQEAWLGAKLGALLLYIVMGMVAFHWGKSRTIKIAFWIGAVMVYLYMISVALNRSPWPF
jgi:uncharacterized membrane protein SirB2